MKKIIIFGASGSLAHYVIAEAQKLEDIALTLFVRNKKRLPDNLPKTAKVIEGNALNAADVQQAVVGQDIVYLNLAGDLASMGANIVHAMRRHGVKRIIAISSIGIYNSPLQSILQPYRTLADLIENSGLDYTILRPDWFTHNNEVDYMLTRKGEPESGSAVSRRSIASFVNRLFTQPTLYINENLGISKPA
ncbi:NAD-dependent dehydratase [Chelonobacter oris]|uniref:NAD-dependent dehydratase n=1 Tax=Chelonobacter oris TaxID=505317 RepID=A0A0A3BC61_9PAST|nr:NAD(P)H-binding protein [Chelonobacter oris]KGQ71119.1 NAD-dependent dehydratase [Chelonobacter oris]